MPAELDDIIKKYPKYQRDNLIPMLQEIQEVQGYLSEEAILKTSQHLGLPTTKIYGVASFYEQFRFEPKGRFHLVLCRGTHCHLSDSEQLLEDIKLMLNIKAGQVSRDGMYSLETTTCMGACGLAPVISVNGNYYEKMTLPNFRELLEQLKIDHLT